MSAISISCRVRCSGALHTISLMKDGALVLHDHPNRAEAERAFVALGGEPCRCLQVLDTWRKRERSALPADLRPALDAIRKKKRFQCGMDPLTVPLRLRAEARIKKLAEAALEQCSYRRSETSWAGGDHIVSAKIGDPAISGFGRRVWSENGKWPGTDSYITATVPLSWFSSVYRRGLAIVDGSFVLDVLAEDAKGITVLAGKQGRGFEVYPCRARITTAKDGSIRLRWLKEVK
jgi:hypothetical protein